MNRILLRVMALLFLLGTTAVQAQRAPLEPPSDRPEQALPVEPIAEVIRDADGDSVPDRMSEWVRIRGVVAIPPGILAQEHF